MIKEPSKPSGVKYGDAWHENGKTYIAACGYIHEVKTMSRWDRVVHWCQRKLDKVIMEYQLWRERRKDFRR